MKNGLLFGQQAVTLQRQKKKTIKDNENTEVFPRTR